MDRDNNPRRTAAGSSSLAGAPSLTTGAKPSALKTNAAAPTRQTASTLAGTGAAANTAGARATATSKPIEEVKDGESSGYSSEFKEEEIE